MRWLLIVLCVLAIVGGLALAGWGWIGLAVTRSTGVPSPQQRWEFYGMMIGGGVLSLGGCGWAMRQQLLALRRRKNRFPAQADDTLKSS